MKLKSFNYSLGLLIIFLSFTPLISEEQIDIWKNNNSDSTNAQSNTTKESTKGIPNTTQSIETSQGIEIENNLLSQSEDIKVFGIYDPADNDFNLNMWSSTKAEDLKSSLKRLEKIKLSKTANQILERILLSFSYPPEDMSEDEFTDLKINWLIKKQRSDLIENFLKQNEDFKSKSKAVQFLVDENIAKANIKEGCEKIKFIDAKVKDSYLEKFKIY
jgi:hypothetical protein